MYEIFGAVVGWGLHAVSAGAATGLVMLLRWQRRTERDVAVLQERVGRGGVSGRPEAVAAVERDLAEFKLHVAEKYIRRDDWVPAVSRIIGMLEGQSEMLARLDERGRARRMAGSE